MGSRSSACAEPLLKVEMKSTMSSLRQIKALSATTAPYAKVRIEPCPLA